MKVVVLSFNHPELTARAVRSALSVGMVPSDVLLVHNGSQENHTSTLRTQFPEVLHEILPSNLGYTGGVNAGLRRAFEHSEWAFLITNDATLESLPVAPSSPKLVAPKILKRKTFLVDSLGGLFEPEDGKLTHFRSSEEFEAAKNRGAFVYAPGTAFLVHRQVFESVGGLDESLGTYWDDVEWAFRVVKQGFEISVDPGVVVRHQIGKTCHGNPYYTLYLFQRNRKKVSLARLEGLQKARLAGILGLEWMRLSTRLARNGRIKDISHLIRAALH